MILACAEEGQWDYWTKDAEHEAARREEKRKIRDVVKEDMQSDGKECKGLDGGEQSYWDPLMGATKIGRLGKRELLKS